MILNFTKMHGLGNDFVVFDFIQQAISLSPEQIRYAADRHFGIGCDQVLILEDSNLQEADVLYRIYNADGAEVEQCGNGARCIALYLREKHNIIKDVITAETTSGLIHLYTEDNGDIRVDMGMPDFTPANIVLDVTEQAGSYSITINDQELTMSALNMGNPHAVFLVEDIDTCPIETFGPQVQQNSLFPQGVNVGFMQILDQKTIKLRVYERGVGETLACGTGACAAVVAGRVNHGLDEVVSVSLPGGSLDIRWQGLDEVVWMSGPATFVYEGSIRL